MNNRKQLIASAFETDANEMLALQAASRVRQRRAVRRAVSAGFAACVIAASVFLLLRPATTQPVQVATTKSPEFEVISDQQLLDQLRDQPVMVVRGENGITRVVFLDDLSRPESDSIR